MMGNRQGEKLAGGMVLLSLLMGQVAAADPSYDTYGT
ncbi:hypothetical protein GLUCOINTEAF2_0202353 [Komagataeibacter intermedius AF2]|uniref:Uncharacterized protein n=1 Tax=Komagataeibacter intermedius AF2 TaxID=1458464 RepID=A0A0N0MF03_9PROT|nr:hypothetical protein GLUCOINTEAF2_0202353 [Komagataeibacter intermedius AF2]